MTNTASLLSLAGPAIALVALASLAGCASHTPLLDCAADGGATPVCGFQNPEEPRCPIGKQRLDDQIDRLSNDEAKNRVAKRHTVPRHGPSEGSRSATEPRHC